MRSKACSPCFQISASPKPDALIQTLTLPNNKLHPSTIRIILIAYVAIEKTAAVVTDSLLARRVTIPELNIMVEQKTQPWRQFWPPAKPVNKGLTGNEAGNFLVIDGSSGSDKGPIPGNVAGRILGIDGSSGSGAGAFGYDDKGTGIAGPKAEGTA